MEVKLYQAKLLGQEGHLIYFGDIKNNMLYQRAELRDGEYSTYLQGGLVENSPGFARKFKFHKDHYVVKTYCGGKLFMVLNLSYNILAEKLSKVFAQHGPRFGKSFYQVRAYDSGASAQLISRTKLLGDMEILTILEKADIQVQVLLNAPGNQTAVLSVR